MKQWLVIAALSSTFTSSGFAFNTSVYYEHTMTDGSRSTDRVYTKISDTFDANIQGRLKDAFQLAVDEVEEFFYTERVLGQTAAFRTCLNKYATKDIHPLQYASADRTKNERITNLMSAMVMIFRIHKQTSLRALIDYFSEPFDAAGLVTVGRAPVYQTQWPDTKINIAMNNVAVQQLGVRDIAGTIFHEIMHNLGWSHPTGYPGSFIKEAGLCIARDNADKSVGFGLVGGSSQEYMLRD